MSDDDPRPDITFGDKLKLILIIAGMAVAILGWPLMQLFS